MDNTQEQMVNLSREGNSIIKRKRLKQNTLTEMKNAFDELINTVD